MPSTGKCQYCDSTISSTDQRCPYCGAPNPNYVENTERTVFLPKTIAELKEYCAERGMPLLRMRFFIGEDYRQPRAFGIYQDGNDFVVYKNKSDGSRAVRYRGPDEEHAVSEIFAKLLEECHNRGIYPDGKPTPEQEAERQKREANAKRSKRTLLLIVAGFLAFSLLTALVSRCQHRNDGYYQFNDGLTWYHYGNDWYYTYNDTSVGSWYEGDAPYGDYDNYYVGDSFDSDWGVSDFKNSTMWDSIQESHSSSSSDYDSWDSGSTDWDSDW